MSRLVIVTTIHSLGTFFGGAPTAICLVDNGLPTFHVFDFLEAVNGIFKGNIFRYR